MANHAPSRTDGTIGIHRLRANMSITPATARSLRWLSDSSEFTGPLDSGTSSFIARVVPPATRPWSRSFAASAGASQAPSLGDGDARPTRRVRAHTLARQPELVVSIRAGEDHSALVEVFQAVLARGSDIDDVILNTVGGVAAFAIVRFAIGQLTKPRRLAGWQ